MPTVAEHWMQEGEKRGEKRGINKGKTKVAINMLNAGFPIEQVVELTGLSQNAVEKLFADLSSSK